MDQSMTSGNHTINLASLCSSCMNPPQDSLSNSILNIFSSIKLASSDFQIVLKLETGNIFDFVGYPRTKIPTDGALAVISAKIRFDKSPHLCETQLNFTDNK